jgi:hypothetical protein
LEFGIRSWSLRLDADDIGGKKIVFFRIAATFFRIGIALCASCGVPKEPPHKLC